MLLALTALALLASADTTPAKPTPGAAEVAIVVHHQPAMPMVALRMALLADDPPGYAGAGHLLQHLAQPRLREQVAQVGGRVQVERTADAVIFTVIGPAAELPFLARVLRTAWQPPRPTEGTLLRASRDLAEERLAEWETASRHVRAALRTRLFPNALPAAGTESSALRLAEPDGPGEAWSQLYRPERISVIAVGAVRIEDVRAAIGELPLPGDPVTGALRDTISLGPLAPAEATRGWVALGYLGEELDAAALSVAARLVGDELRERLPAATVETEHWWSHHGQALAVVIATSDSNLAAARRAAATGVSLARQALTSARVREAARAIRREMLFYARTPDRMAEVLGQFTDREGEGDAAQRFYAELELVDEESVGRVLDVLIERTPHRFELPPQRLAP